MRGMMDPMNGVVWKVFYGMVVLAFLCVGTFGLFYHMGEMRMGGGMNGCLFSGNPTMCGVSFVEHIARWQSLFTATPTEIGAAMLAIMIALFVVSAIALLGFWSVRTARVHAFSRSKYISIRTFDAACAMLVSGIMHPKRYSVVTA